jgi:quinol monooxygenase YgiN
VRVNGYPNFLCHRYKDAEALKAHGKFPEFKEMNRTLVKEGLLDPAKKTEVHVMSSIGGLKSRL